MCVCVCVCVCVCGCVCGCVCVGVCVWVCVRACHRGVNFDLGNGSFSVKIRDAKHVDRSSHLYM